MRRLRSVLAGVPGGGVHHDGARRSECASRILGAAHGSKTLTTLIRHRTVVTSKQTVAADILIDGERIKEIAPGISADAANRVIDAAGMLVLPGGIDVHTHLDMPFGGTTSSDDFETGTKAAAFGGTTTLIDFAVQ